MITTKEKRDEFVNSGSEIKDELLSIFSADGRINIADIGSCDGLSSVIYSRIFPKAFLFVFEPLDTNVKQIYENFMEYGISDRTIIYPYTLGDVRGTVKFYQSYGQAEWVEGWETGNKSSSLLRPKKHLQQHVWCKFKESKAEVRRLDDIGLMSPVDFAHIDVQGAEIRVLKGGAKTFKGTKAIWLEVANIDLYDGQPLKADICRHLCNDFNIVKDTCGKDKSGDVLFVRK
ncbi:MAG: FkbM family methyltransferase [Thermoplasmata archaeon]|nr:FkbM family methyltransferase [Thermoplasmata archaeon]MBE3139214.1 FkbM family methyltransferase [Thermoplasmata archaeon]